MKKPDSFFCDICGIAKGETNHWRVLRVWSPAQAETFSRGGSLAIYGWDDKAAARKGSKHACGNSCTQKLVERWLALKTLEAPRAAGGAA
jgi:hypothetical protein